MQNKETFVSLLSKVKRRYYETLNEKSVIDNKLFWKTVKPFLSDKIVAKNKINLTENGELIKTDVETAEILNDFFFSNIIQNLDITRYSNNEPFLDNIKDSTMKAILKYRNHPSIITI